MPDHGDVNHRHEVFGQLLVASCDATEFLQPSNCALDPAAATISGGSKIFSRTGLIAAMRCDGLDTMGSEPPSDSIRESPYLPPNAEADALPGHEPT